MFDVGGNVGDFAETCRGLWPHAAITSFEPVPQMADANRERSRGRWWVETVALSDVAGVARLSVCTNQHSVSTMQHAGEARRQLFGLVDHWQEISVPTKRLDDYLHLLPGLGPKVLVKIDVEGHEGRVLAGGAQFLGAVDVVIVETQNRADVFIGAPAPAQVSAQLYRQGFTFAGLYGALVERGGDVVQFDGIWQR